MNDLIWARVDAILADIERAALPFARQPDDREALDIICRIERKLLSRKGEICTGL